MDFLHIGGLPKNFLQPGLLLLLKEQPGYGYDLVARLKVLGIDDDSASVYRALRSLEGGGIVVSYWNTSETGPARRMYRLTPKGEEMLEESVRVLEDTRRAIERYLCRHALTRGAAPEADPDTEAAPDVGIPPAISAPPGEVPADPAPPPPRAGNGTTVRRTVSVTEGKKR